MSLAPSDTRLLPTGRAISALLAALLAAHVLASGAAAQTAEPPAAAPATPAADPAPPESAADFGPDDVVATVDGAEIRLEEVIAVYSALPPNVQALPDETLWEGIVSQLIDESVIRDAAIDAGLEERRDVRLAIEAQRRAILANAYLDTIVGDRLTEEAVEAEYRKRYVDVEPVKQVRASHILLKEEADAKQVLAEIQGGMDFAEAAKEHSTGPTGPNGGDLGYFEKEQMVPEFAEAAFAMQVGEVSAAPVKTDFGWHLIKIYDIRDRPAPDFDGVGDTLRQELTAQIAKEALGDLRASAQIANPETSIPPSALRETALIAPPAADPAEKAPVTENAPVSAPAPTPAPAAN